MKRQCHFSVIGPNKCGKITIKHWEMDLFLFYILLSWGVRTHPTHPLAYEPEVFVYMCVCFITITINVAGVHMRY